MLGVLFGAIAAGAIAKGISNAAMAGAGAIVETATRVHDSRKQIKEMEMVNQTDPEGYIRIRAGYEDFLNRDFRDVVRDLAGMGFYDIYLKENYVRKGFRDKDQTAMVSGVFINGARSFRAFSLFPKSSHIVVEAIVHGQNLRLNMPELEAIRQRKPAGPTIIKRCEYCGVIVSEGQKYCGGCGAPL